jgi:uncharacterized protein YjbI with pentapeptide repeats
MANPEHLAILTQGVEEWNKWRREHPGIRADFTGAYISETSMDWAEPDIPGKLGIADLEGFNLRGASFAYARLQGAILRNADLFGANLRGANLRRADLRGADLRQAKFLGTNLTLANLSQANVAGAIFWETVLARVNMNGTIGLKDCHHGGPSVLDERTMRRSGGLPLRSSNLHIYARIAESPVHRFRNLLVGSRTSIVRWLIVGFSIAPLA